MRRPHLAALSLTLIALACSPSSTEFGALAGKVILTGVDPRSGVQITLSGPISATAETDSAGGYAFDGLPLGDYAVSATLGSTAEGASTVRARVGARVNAAPDLVFTPRASVAGLVVLAGSPPAEGLAVTLGGPVSRQTATDASGAYAFDDLPLGDYVVTVTEPSSMQGSASIQVRLPMGASIAPDLHLIPLGTVSGKVVLTGTPPGAGIVVELRLPQGAVLATTSTDSSGSYQFQSVYLGDWLIRASAPSTVEGKAEVAIDVPFGSSTAPDLVFSPLGAIAGSVTLAGVANAGVPVWLEGTERAVLTDTAGHYALASVPVGSYTVVASFAGYTAKGAAGQAVAYATTTAVPTLDLSLAPPGAVAKGRLAGRASVVGLGPLPGITVSVDGAALSAVTAADGTWAIDGVPEGSWSLTLTDGARTEHVPAALSLPGTDGFLVDGAPYPIGDIELQNALRVSQTSSSYHQLTSDGHLLVLDGTDLLSAPLAGGPTVRIASGVARFHLPDSTTPGARSWVAVVSSDQSVSAVAADGAAALPIAKGAWVHFDPTGAVLMVSGLDGRLWYAALDRADVRPVASGDWLRGETDGYFLFGASTAGDLSSVEYATGNVATLATNVWTAQALGGGTRLLVKEKVPGNYGDVLVGPLGGPLVVISQASSAVYNMSERPSPDGRWVLVQRLDLSTGRTSLVLASATDGSVVHTELDADSPEWAPDSRHFTWAQSATVPDAGYWLGDAASGTFTFRRVARTRLFSADGAYVAFYDGSAARVVETSTGADVAASPAGLGSIEPIAFSAGSAFAFVGGGSLYSLSTAGGAPVLLSSTYLAGSVELSPDGAWVLFLSGEGLCSAPVSGSPVTVLVPPGPLGRTEIVAPTNAVVLDSGELRYVPIDGGAPWSLGAPSAYASWPSASPDGLAVAHLAADGTLRSGLLPDGAPIQVATGVTSFQSFVGGLAARDAVGGLWIASHASPATRVTSSPAVYAEAPGGHSSLLALAGGRLLSVEFASGVATVLASGLDEPFAFSKSLRGDTALVSAAGVLSSIPVAGGLMTPHVRMEAGGDFEWIEDRHVLVERTQAPPPYRFQNGLYLVSVP
jgi:hypothetical protein